jgi:hypothetical protein
MEKKWTGKIKNWGIIYSQLVVSLENRMISRAGQ